MERPNQTWQDSSAAFEVEALKHLGHETIREQLRALIQDQHKFQSKPNYIEAVQRQGFTPGVRRQLVKLFLDFNLAGETSWIACNLVDRVLSKASKTLDEVKLIAVASLALASKLHSRPLPVGQLISCGLLNFSKKDVASCEWEICNSLGFDITSITPYELMLRVVLLLDMPERLECVIVQSAKTLLDGVLSEYTFLQFSSLSIAVAAILQAMRCAKQPASTFWAKTEDLGVGLSNIEINTASVHMDHFLRLYSAVSSSILARSTTTTGALRSPKPQQHSPKPTMMCYLGACPFKTNDREPNPHGQCPYSRSNHVKGTQPQSSPPPPPSSCRPTATPVRTKNKKRPPLAEKGERNSLCESSINVNSSVLKKRRLLQAGEAEAGASRCSCANNRAGCAIGGGHLKHAAVPARTRRFVGRCGRGIRAYML
jgi:hypothetical protein